MSLFSAILLGLVQGITEFLPISSSGHLAIAEELLSFTGASNVPGFFDVLLLLGTLVAVFVAYWGDIKEMVLELFCGVRDLKNRSTPSPLPPARRLIVLIIMATLPLFVIVPFKDTIEGLAGSLYFVSFALIATGCMLFFSDRVKKGRKTEKTATMKAALIVGLGQAIAPCPGISRSGTTITVGCFVGYERSFAVRFSFLMSIPAILGANILSLKDALEAGIIWGDVPVYLVGVAVAALSGYACIRLLKMIAAKGKFGAVAYYCWAGGALTLVMTVVRG